MKIFEIFKKYRTSYLIIVSNIAVLVLLLLGYLNISSTLMTYVVESLIIGFFALIKFILAKSKTSFSAKIFLCLFFIIHFGIFIFVQLSFVIGIFISESFNSALEINTDPRILLFSLLNGILISSAILFLSHAISFISNYFIRGERNTISPESFLFLPYPRIILMQLTIMIGGAVSVYFNQNIAIFSVFLILKTWFDLLAHSKERLKFSIIPETRQ